MARQRGAEKQLNPTPYYAPFFGYNLHMDQNEKLERYGVVYVMVVDGCSGYITAVSVMPCKNNITIYREVYLQSILEFGLWDQIIVDHGREFYLTLWIQECLSLNRSRQHRPSVKQVPSTSKNNRIERMWVELNKRVSYPIKYCLIDMEHRDLIDADIQHHRFSASVVCSCIALVGSKQMARMWNAHTVPGYGKPTDYIQSRQNTVVDKNILPSPYSASNLYQQNFGRLTEEHLVGVDLLVAHPNLILQRNNEFEKLLRTFGGWESIFGHVANRAITPFRSMLFPDIFISLNSCTIQLTLK